MLPSDTGESQPILTTKSDDQPPARSILAHLSRHGTGDFVWVAAGRVTQMGVNAVLMLLLAQTLDLLAFGLLVTVISGQLLLSRALLLGVEAGIVRLHTVPEMRQQLGALLGAGFAVIRWMSLGTVLLTFAIIWASTSLEVGGWPIWAIASVVAGAIGVALVDYCYSAFLSHVRYRAASLMYAGVASLRLAITALFALTVPQHPEFVFFAYTGVSLIAGLALAAVFARGGGDKSDGALIRRLLRYSVWQGGANLVGVLNLYQGTFLLEWLGQRVATAGFGLALTLSMGFFAAYLAFLDYLQPRAARIESVAALPSFLARTTRTALLLSLGCVPIALVLGLVISRSLRPELQGLAPVFYCLSASMLVLLCQSPLMVACQYLMRPQLATVNLMLRITCVAGLALVLAPTRGAAGMAIAQLAGTMLASIVLGVQVVFAFRAARNAARRLATT